PLHRLRHLKLYGPMLLAADGPFMPFDLRRLKTRFPYLMFLPQEVFLSFLAEEARKYPHFRLVMGASVERLVEGHGGVCGVRYRAADGWHEVRAPFTVGADGRFSRVRHLAGLEAVPTSPPFNVVWFRLPRMPEDARQFATTAPAPANRVGVMP